MRVGRVAENAFEQWNHEFNRLCVQPPEQNFYPPATSILTIGPLADAVRDEGAQAERERIRLALLAEADRLMILSADGYAEPDTPEDALRDFARRLEAKR